MQALTALSGSNLLQLGWHHGNYKLPSLVLGQGTGVFLYFILKAETGV